MPKATKQTTAKPQIRRSSRLRIHNSLQGTDPRKNEFDEAEGNRHPKRRKIANDEVSFPESSLCATEAASEKLHNALDRRRSQRITPAELIKRERNLVKKEEECRKRASDLEQSSFRTMEMEAEARNILIEMQDKEAAATLAQLEEHFTCPLCYEVMAHPYILNPGQCGHTFCGLCILKWFFSRLHVTCGGWHESVDCPICRSLLVITPDQPPRPNTTFPFVPNRIATAVCESLIEKLAKYPPGSRLTVKREDSEGALGPGAGWDMVGNRKEGMAKLEEGKPVETTGAAGWKEGGTIRAEWLKKNRDGKREMGHLLACWTTMRSHDFILLKHKLGV